MNTVPLTRAEWGACITLGFTVIPIALVLKLTPAEWVDKIPSIINEDEKN
jgi:hypothetical protein